MTTYRAYTDFAAFPDFAADTDGAAIVHAHTLTTDRPIRVYRVDASGELTALFGDTATDTATETAATVDTATETAPRVNRKICRRDGCGVVCDKRYYVNTPTGRSLWCGGCVRTHAMQVGQDRWDVACLVVDCRGRRRPPAQVAAWDTCDYCDRPGDRDTLGVYVDQDGTMHTACQSCVNDNDAGHTRRLPADYSDDTRVNRWADDRHPEVWGVTTSRYGDIQWQWASPHHATCPACDVTYDRRHVSFNVVDCVGVDVIGPQRIAVCHGCTSHTRQDGDTVSAYHHTTAVHPVRVVDGALVRDDTIGPDAITVRGDRGYAGRTTSTADAYTGRRRTRRAPWLGGLEVELAAVGETTPGQIARYCRETWGVLHAESKADSSIQSPRGSGGVEVVSHPATIGAFRSVFRNWKAPAGAEANTSCGMHVHVSREALSPGQIDRLCYILSRRGDVSTWTKVFRRTPNNYCRTYTPGSFARRRWRDETDRYRVLNITPRHTIELRWPASTVRGDVILATVEIFHALCLYTQAGAPGGSHRSDVLCWSAFVAWLQSDPLARSETKTARPYLAARGLISGRKNPRARVRAVVDDGTDDTIDPDMVAATTSTPAWARIRTALAT